MYRVNGMNVDVKESDLVLIGDAVLTNRTAKVLGEGPKTCVVDKPSPLDVVTAIRNMAEKLPEDERYGFIYEANNKVKAEDFPPKLMDGKVEVRKALKELREKDLVILEADKTSEFVVMAKAEEEELMIAAFAKSFIRIDRNSTGLTENKQKVLKILENLPDAKDKNSVYNKVRKNNEKYLNAFAKFKTHKVEPSLRVITDEGETFQSDLSHFIKKGLVAINQNDPFKVRNSEEAISRMNEFHGQNVKLFSLDAEDMFYNLDVGLMLEAVEEAIVEFGHMKFRELMSMEVITFLELLEIYLQTTVVKHKDKYYRQKKGVCIGSRLASYLSDIYMAKVSRLLMEQFTNEFAMSILLILRFVDDLLILAKKEAETAWLRSAFEKLSRTLKFTSEEATNGVIRFLDLQVFEEELCWEYSPREAKKILKFSSNHSKMIKNGIVQGVLRNSCVKSCEHKIRGAVKKQTVKLEKRGYPSKVIHAQSRCLARKFLHEDGMSGKVVEERRTAGIPFFHTVSHGLMNVGNKYDLRTVFQFPTKLAKLVSGSNRPREKCAKAVSTHTKFVACTTGCVYSIPLTCGGSYVGQTMKCVNERLTQHSTNVKNHTLSSGKLVKHIEDCACKVQFDKSEVLGGRSQDRKMREIWEAFIIEEGGERVISDASINLQEIEFENLRKRPPNGK
jgi:hypothetical protein